MIAVRSGDAIDIPDRPSIEGLVFRHFRGPQDYPGMVAANAAARGAHSLSDRVTVEGMASFYANLTNSDVERDLVIVELGGEIVGYFRVQWDDQRDGSRAWQSVALLRPDLCGRGIGSAMLTWIETRSREIAAEQPDDGRPRWMQAFAWDSDAGAARLLTERGYQPVRRSYEMLRPDLDAIPDKPLPDGIEVRPVTRADIRRVWEADAEAFRDHWGEVDESEEAFGRFADDPDVDPDLIVVGWDGDEIAGLVVNTLEPAADDGSRQGLLASVAVRRPWRRRGLARALIARSLHLLRERGASRAYLGVDGENPNMAMTLYESCGFRVATSQTIWRKPFTGDA